MAARRTAFALVAGLLLLTSCSPPATPAPVPTTTIPVETSATPTTTSSTTLPPTPLDPTGDYAVIAFTNHLPQFGTLEDGTPDRPWVRLHTTRDYLTMTRLIAESGAKVVLSYSPVLLEQIAAVAAGQLDQAAIITAKPATDLTTEDKAYIDLVFFDSSPDQIDRFPRYRELADRRAAGLSLTSSDYRDLQVLFNLAWSSPLMLEADPLLSLAAKGRGFSEADKQIVLDAHVAAVIEFEDNLRALTAAGSIELATTPLSNPTLPLLVRSRMDEDAADQIIRGHDVAAEVLGTAPRGLAPAYGLISQANGPALAEAGYQWLLLSADEATQPTRLTSEDGSLVIFASSPDFNDPVARTYFTVDPDEAAFDVVSRVTNLAPGAGRVVTLTADGTEPWGRYEDGGVAFMRSLFRQLASANDFATALPSALIASIPFEPAPDPPIPDSFLSDPAELAAWAYLADTRSQLLRSRDIGAIDSGALDAAYDLILEGEGSDWYWWYGTERASGDDAYYDELFRYRLRTAWELLGETPPEWTDVPLHPIPAIAPSIQNRGGPATVVIDNRITDTEWSSAGVYEERGSQLIHRVFYTFDAANLIVRVDFEFEVLGENAPGFDLYLGGPSADGRALSNQGKSLGFEATGIASWRATNPVRIGSVRPYPGAATSDDFTTVGFDGDSIEFAIPLDTIAPDLRAGDQISFRILDVTGGPEGEAFPIAGHGSFDVPNLQGGTELVVVEDRLRDDHGPGGYSYLVDSEVAEGTYDLEQFAVRLVGGEDDLDLDAAREVQFEVKFREPLTNPWSAPAGFSHQTIDIYIEAYPGSGSGAERLLPGRVAAVEEGAGWDYALSVDGWGAGQFSADAAQNVTRLNSPIEYRVLSDRRTVLIIVNRSDLPEGDEAAWRYGVAALANRAIPSLGIHSLQTLAATPGRFQLGGGTPAVNDPLLIDVLYPESGVQEELLTPPQAIAVGDPELMAVSSLGRIPFVGALG